MAAQIPIVATTSTPGIARNSKKRPASPSHNGSSAGSYGASKKKKVSAASFTQVCCRSPALRMRGAVRGGARARAQSRAELAGTGPRCRAFQVLEVSPPLDAVAGAEETFFLNVGKWALGQAPHALHCPREQGRWRCCCRLSGMIIPSRLARLRPRTSLSFRQAQVSVLTFVLSTDVYRGSVRCRALQCPT